MYLFWFLFIWHVVLSALVLSWYNMRSYMRIIIQHLLYVSVKQKYKIYFFSQNLTTVQLYKEKVESVLHKPCLSSKLFFFIMEYIFKKYGILSHNILAHMMHRCKGCLAVVFLIFMPSIIVFYNWKIYGSEFGNQFAVLCDFLKRVVAMHRRLACEGLDTQ